MILEKAGLSTTVKVVGGGRVEDGYVINDVVKGELVDHIRFRYNAQVVAFGDSPKDLPMLKGADRAVVVVGEKDLQKRNHGRATRGCHHRGAPSEVRSGKLLSLPRHLHGLTPSQLPVIDLNDPTEIDLLLDRYKPDCSFTLEHATDRASAKLLATPTRDANISGPALREAHSTICAYLATEFVSHIIGLRRVQHPSRPRPHNNRPPPPP
jgi:hypothetical protein